MGYRDLEKVRPIVKDHASAAIALLAEVAEPVAHYKRVPIKERSDDRLRFEAGITISCPAFPTYLAGCEELIVFVLTLGQAFDSAQAEYTANEQLLEAMMLDTAGWLGVEKATRQFAEFLQETADAEGYRISRRMAPGYSYRLNDAKCDWPLIQQAALFQLLGTDDMPVDLLESCAMVPKMSRSGIYGLLPKRAGQVGFN